MAADREAIRKVESEPCRCVTCDSCGGTGSIWVDLHGNYLGRHRSDDMDNPEPCEECRNGVVEVCERCQLLEEMEDAEY